MVANEEWMKKDCLEKIWNGCALKKKEKSSNFMEAEVTSGMREKGIKSMEMIDKKEWIKMNKLKFLGTERYEKFNTLYKQIKKNAAC